MENKDKAIEFLIKDEKEAIRGYEEKMKDFTPEQRKIIAIIIEDEKRHIKLLENMKETRRVYGD